MEIICDKKNCCGCEACKNICPRGAIFMKEDEYGVKYPSINKKLCINCGMCKKVCPQINDVSKNKVISCNAATIKNYNERLDCASGGIGYILYNSFLRQHENSIVFGVEFDENNRATFTSTRDYFDLDKYKGSKYVQAEVGNLYKNIIDALKENMYVLVVATPCQIAAIKNILDIKKIDSEKLITVDLICHGVSPSKYLEENLQYLIDKYDWKKILKLTFRSNRKYRNFHIHIEYENKNNRKKIYNRYSDEDPYFYSFLKGIGLRENCYNCKYSNTNRVSDLTIGDFIGLGKHPGFEDYTGNKENVSIILCNTEKGQKYIDSIRNTLCITERSLKEALISGTSLKAPFPKHELRDEFLKNYKKIGFVNTMYLLAKDELNKKGKKEHIIRPIKIWIASREKNIKK